MHSKSGESNGENISNPERPSTALTVSKGFTRTDLLQQALGRHEEPPAEVRRVKRGKFFLTDFEMEKHASLKRPIFQYWGHNVVVGQQDYYPALDGYWCFGTHPDFDLIPEFTPLEVWPDYVRTETGWKRADGMPSLEAQRRTKVLLEKLSSMKRISRG